jgi:hypothetical protein
LDRYARARSAFSSYLKKFGNSMDATCYNRLYKEEPEDPSVIRSYENAISQIPWDLLRYSENDPLHSFFQQLFFS